MLKEKIAPVDSLEEAVLAKDNVLIVKLIAEGAELTRPDILAAKEAFELYYPAAVLLLESASCLREESALLRLEELEAHPEMVDLVRDLVKPLPENTHPKSDELLEAFKSGDHLEVANLILNDGVTLDSAPMELFESLEEFPQFAVEALFGKALGARLNAQLFLHLRNTAKNSGDNRKMFIFEVLQLVLSLSLPENPEQNQAVHAVWRHYTTPPFIKAIAAEPEKYTDGCLAWLIIDELLDFKVRPFKAFAPYYQALLLNNGCVTSEQFEKEAEIEKFDAKAVFELLSHNGKYADRINWELVNKTAKARNLLEFLDEHPQYADKADWQMLTTQVDSGDWIMFLKNHPDLLEKHQNHAELYCDFHMFWEEDILPESGIPYGNCFAAIILDYPDFNYCFKVRINDGKAEFFEISDPGTYQKYAELAEKDFDAFCKTLKNPGWDKESTPDLYDDGNEYFVPVIR